MQWQVIFSGLPSFGVIMTWLPFPRRPGFLSSIRLIWALFHLELFHPFDICYRLSPLIWRVFWHRLTMARAGQRASQGSTVVHAKIYAEHSVRREVPCPLLGRHRARERLPIRRDPCPRLSH